MRYWISIIVIVVVGVLVILAKGCSGVEIVRYYVLEKEGNFEIREYPGYLVAETVVDSDFEQAGNVAFSRLFDYISGENRMKEKIAMTAPVNQQSRSEKIAMTAPVNQVKAGDQFAIQFVMPDKYTMDTLPEPLDEAVVIKEVAAHKMAVVRYSGGWSAKAYEKHKELLYAFIKDKGLSSAGEPVWARYDPPFKPAFLRRNEVQVPVE